MYGSLIYQIGVFLSCDYIYMGECMKMSNSFDKMKNALLINFWNWLMTILIAFCTHLCARELFLKQKITFLRGLVSLRCMYILKFFGYAFFLLLIFLCTASKLWTWFSRVSLKIKLKKKIIQTQKHVNYMLMEIWFVDKFIGMKSAT